jgi:LPS sulfotransferase NodH
VTKFVILGHGRTGSTLLALAMRQHPGVLMHGEAFARDQEQRRQNVRRKDPYVDGRDAGEYLEYLFQEEHGDWPLATGIKLFYDHAREQPAAERAWDWLAARRDVHIVHLTRANLLASWASSEVARRTGEWFRPVHKQQVEPPSGFTVDAQACARFFEGVSHHRAWTGRVFAQHPRLELEYEADLCDDFDGTMAKVWTFLALPAHRCERLLSKQRRGPLRDQILNYDELKRYFAATPHARYFD